MKNKNNKPDSYYKIWASWDNSTLKAEYSGDSTKIMEEWLKSTHPDYQKLYLKENK